MKIHFIASSLKGGGAERVLTLLANELYSRDHNVSIITMNAGQTYPLHSSIYQIKFHDGFFSNHTLRSFTNLFRYYRLKRNRPDIAIAFMPRMSLISIVICKIFGIKVVGCEHNNHLRKTERWERFTWNNVYRFADKITVLTEFDRKFFVDKNVNVEVMPNPCTFTSSKIVVKREPVILAVGGLDRIYHKGFDNLLELIPPILKEFPDWKLKIAGSGENGLKVLSGIAKENKIEDQVEFLGFVSDIESLMNKSEIFILPSRYEGLPMVLLEAMSQGMSCIAYDCKTGPSDIIVHNENGLLIEDQNMKAMQIGLEMLIENPELRNRLSNNAIRSLERFSIKNILTKWEKLFAEIL